MSLRAAAAATVGAGGVLYYLYRAGLFTKPKMDVVEAGPLRIAYKVFGGPYEKCGPHFDDVVKAVGEKEGKKLFGLFLDDPYLVPGEHCRYAVGVDDAAAEARLTEAGYAVQDLPAAKSVHTTFPFTSTLSLIIATKVKRIYSKIYSYVDDHRLVPEGKNVVCYDIYSATSPKEFWAGSKIDYFIPVDPNVDLDAFMLGQVPMKEHMKNISGLD